MDSNEPYFWPFPRRMRLLIDETRVSQQEIADYVGVSRQAVSQWKDGKTIPDMYNFKKIAEFFKVPMEYLYGETDSKIKEYLALADSIGLSDKAIDKLQAWAKEKPSGLSFPLTEILSDIIADSSFDEFIERMQLVICEYMEHRFYTEYEGNKEAYEKHGDLMKSKEQDADDYARYFDMRAIKAVDLALFYRYQSIQALENVLSALPGAYYDKHYQQLLAEQEESLNGEYTAEEE